MLSHIGDCLQKQLERCFLTVLYIWLTWCNFRHEMLYPDFFDAKTNPKPANRTIFILANFNADHGRYRKAALETFSNISVVQPLNSDTRFERFGEYLKLLTHCQFVLSPPGNQIVHCFNSVSILRLFFSKKLTS